MKQKILIPKEAADFIKATANVDTFTGAVRYTVSQEFYEDESGNMFMEQCDGNCGMSYCDENGCIERRRFSASAEPKFQAESNNHEENR